MSDSTTEAATVEPAVAGVGDEGCVPPVLTDTPSPLVKILPLPTSETHDLVYSCRKCRQALFRPEHLMTHDRNQHAFSYLRMVKDKDHERGAGRAVGCTSLFVKEPLAWMKEASESIEGKLCCPKCATRVGSLNWSGAQCSCGTWVTPALQIYKKSVDDRYIPRAAPKGEAAVGAGAGAGRTTASHDTTAATASPR